MIKIWLKDGTYLDCVIYENGESGQLPITHHNRIHFKFLKIVNHENFKDGLIHFQSAMINGKLHANNVVHYEIYEEKSE